MEIKHTQTDWDKKTEVELLELVYKYASNGLRIGKSTQARAWLKEKCLSVDTSLACFNSGQIHHRKEQEFKAALERIGFMKKANVGSNCDSIPYSIFGNFSVMFPLRNEKNKIVNFYSVGIKNEKRSYLNLNGLYPGYPHELTTRLFVVDNVVDAATLLEAKILDNREAVIALYDGILLDQHKKVISGLKHLKEIVQIKIKSE